MDKFSLYVPNFLPSKECFLPENNRACPGCGLALAIRQAYKSLGNEMGKAQWQPFAEDAPSGETSDIFGVGKTEVSFLRISGKKGNLVLCLDNEAGGSLNESLEKPMPSIAVAEGFRYAATACPSYPFDLAEKIKRGIEAEGNAYIHILCPCPQTWQFEPELTVKVGRWAVESRAFPLYEVGGGVYQFNVMVPKPRKIADYLKIQKRFESLSDKEIEEAQSFVENEYKKLDDTIQKYLDTPGIEAASS
jgi:pyruvate/2-oxoacid:ferredoxin oxidoreductase beta subunit